MGEMKNIIPAIVIISLLCSCSIETGQPKVCVICCGMDYANCPLNTLEGTVDDACEFGLCLNDIYSSTGIESRVEYLISKGPQPDVESEYYPSAGNIVRAVEAAGNNGEGLLVFFFSGHGEEFGDKACLVCGATEDSKNYSTLMIDDLLNLFEKKNCQCLVILDSCYSGYALGSGIREKDFSNVNVICSCMKDQKSAESVIETDEGTEERHGLFTYRLLECLGWVHSVSEVRTVCSGSMNHRVRGYLGQMPSVFSVEDLFSEILSEWETEFQFPVENKNAIGVMLFP